MQASSTKTCRTRRCRASSTPHSLLSSTRSRNSTPNVPALPASKTRTFFICWFFSIAWACCAPTAARARVVSSNSFAASSPSLPSSSARSPASSSRSAVFAAQPFLPALSLPNGAVRLFGRLSCRARLHSFHLLRHCRCIPSQRQLRARRRVFLFHPRPRPKTIRLADQCHAFRSFPAVLFRCIAILRVPFFILLRQPRKLLPHKRQELLCRRRHEEQHSREKPLCSSVPRRSRNCFQISVAVRDSGYERRRRNSNRQPRLTQMFHRAQAQIRSGRSRLQQARQSRPQSRNRNTDRQVRPFRDALQHIDIVHNLVRLGDQRNAQPFALRQFLQTRPRYATLPLRGLIRVGRRSDRDMFRLRPSRTFRRIAVFARKLAASVRIDRPFERYALRIAPVQDRLHRQHEILRPLLRFSSRQRWR